MDFRQVLGLPPSATNAPFDLRNETWACVHALALPLLHFVTIYPQLHFVTIYRYAVEDIVLGDILKQGVDFFWIDWQQGGSQGGLSGDKQNPTMWLNHLRCTDRCNMRELHCRSLIQLC